VEMNEIQKFAAKKLKERKDDDVVDRLNYYWTSSILGTFVMLSMAKQYVGRPIQGGFFRVRIEKYSLEGDILVLGAGGIYWTMGRIF